MKIHKYDGIVIRMDELFLFILDPETNMIKDGVSISEHECYKDLSDGQIMVVNVIFKDGTKELDIDLDEFIYGDKYGQYDIFLYINDVMKFEVNIENEINEKLDKITIQNIIDKGDLNNVAIDCITKSKKEINDNE